MVLTGVMLALVLLVMVGERAQEMQLAHWLPNWLQATGVLSRPVVIGENPSNNVFVDLDVERQGDLQFADSPSWYSTASYRRPHEGVLRSVLSGLASVGDSVRIASGAFACSCFVKA
jgi:hypothetical protein